jgi:hypothetical protein
VYDRQDKRELADRERAIVEELRSKRKADEPPIPGGPGGSPASEAVKEGGR